MRHPEGNLITPLYLALDEDLPWPEDPAFYMLASNGLFICRNDALFRSSVPARHWPSELATHQRFLDLRHPKVPRRQFELILGFFSKIAELHRAEAAALLLWDRVKRRLKFTIPPQQATVFEGWSGKRSPLDVRYEIPDLPEEVSVIGDVHSHVDGRAYSSLTDRRDEEHRAGLHVVVGRIFRDRPEYHCEFVVDGMRFAVDPPSVLGTGHRPATDIPEEWIDRVEVEVERPKQHVYYDERGYKYDERGYKPGPSGPRQLTRWRRR